MTIIEAVRRWLRGPAFVEAQAVQMQIAAAAESVRIEAADLRVASSAQASCASQASRVARDAIHRVRNLRAQLPPKP